MQQPRKNKIILKAQIISLSFFLAFFTPVYCQKTLRVSFIERDIQLNENSLFYKIKINHNLVLITKNLEDSTLQCYIFKRNKLKLFGKLIIVQEDSTLLALRHGYWRTYLSNEKYVRNYYYRDEKVENEAVLPEEYNNVEKY